MKEKSKYNIAIIITLMILIICFICCPIAIYVQYATNTSPANNTITTSANEDVTSDSNCISDANESNAINIQNYHDVVVATNTALIIALISISVTVFAFLKSVLDRLIDENCYISNIANEYKHNMINELAYNCSLAFFSIAIIIAYHVVFTNPIETSTYIKTLSIAGSIFSIIVNIIFSVIFWFKCINVEEQLEKIISAQIISLESDSNDFLKNSDENNYRLDSILLTWFDFVNKESPTVKIDELCKSVTKDQFTNLFFKTKSIISSNNESNNHYNYDIMNIFIERKNILNANNIIEEKDLQDRKYIDQETTSVYQVIEQFEHDIGYCNNMNTSYFSEIQKHFDLLSKACDLIISFDYVSSKNLNHSIRCKKNNSKLFKNENTLAIFSKLLYFFVIRVLATFASSIKITGLSLNGFSLCNANFYSSTLEDISWYGSDFYQTVFARTKLNKVAMDISHFSNIDFFYTSINTSSLNKSILEYSVFDNSSFTDTSINSCIFKDSKFTNSIFLRCDLSNGNFTNCQIESMCFTKSQMRYLSICNSDISHSNFVEATLQNWNITNNNDKDFLLIDCDFSKSIWINMKTNNWDMSKSIFSNANLSNTAFDHSKLESAVFFKCDLSKSEFNNCNLKQVSLESAILYKANFKNCNLSLTNLIDIKAVEAVFFRCNLSLGNSPNSEFSKSNFIFSNLNALRLYNCSMVCASFYHCNCKNLLADHIRFTYAKCTGCNFSFSTISESNYTESKFIKCNFYGCDMSNSSANKTNFLYCKIKKVDFSNTRFVDAVFCGDKNSRYTIIEDCNFSICSFEGVRFENIRFKNCKFYQTQIINSKYNQSSNDVILNEQNIKDITDITIGIEFLNT